MYEVSAKLKVGAVTVWSGFGVGPTREHLLEALNDAATKVARQHRAARFIVGRMRRLRVARKNR